MYFFKTLFSGLLAVLCSALAVAAAPVTFTYTSNLVDWSEMEDWEAKYMAGSYSAFNLWRPQLQASITVEVDCAVSATDVVCDSLTTAGWTTSPSWNGTTTVTMKGKSGFTDLSVYISAFAVGRDGTVQEWGFEGGEYRQVGDFKLSHTGDSWEYAGWAGHPEELYCTSRYGLFSYDTRNRPDTCTNGEAVFAEMPKLRWELGTGVWTSNLAEVRAVNPVPLPAGWPLLLTAMGALAVLRRRAVERCAVKEILTFYKMFSLVSRTSCWLRRAVAARQSIEKVNFHDATISFEKPALCTKRRFPRGI